ncbi:MAG: translation initiation factor IF-2 [Angelakisella sp.]
MLEKYRVNEVAKDLGTSTKEIATLLDNKFEGEPHKNMTALSREELNYVFEEITQKKDAPGLDSYFAMKKPEPKVEAPKPAAAPAAPSAPAAAGAPKPVAPAAPAATEAPKPAAPAAPAATEAPKPASTDAPATPPARKTIDFVPGQRTYNTPNGQRTFNRDGTPQGGQRPPYNNNNNTGAPRPPFNNNAGGQRPPYNNNNNTGAPRPPYNNNAGGQRPPYNNNNNTGAPRPPYNGGGQGGQRPPYNNNNNSGAPRPPYNGGGQGGQRPPYGSQPPRNPAAGNTPPKPMPAPPVFDGRPIEIKAQEPKRRLPRDERGTAPVSRSAPATPVVVDMRSSEVNLEKYNERYETIAPVAAQKDNIVKKQKLNQRSARRGKPVMSRKEREEEKLRRLEMERQRRQRLEVTLPEEISVGDLAAVLKVQASEIVKRLMPLGIMASFSDIIDYDTAALVAIEIGAKVERQVVVTIEERLFEQEDEETNSVSRPPVVVIMGHVDHGKTSLLDAIRDANVVSGEAGGITQHIGAYQVAINGKPITFLDTPGHAAFTSMRARGAQVTDIAVLVVAADDGIMPQTIEAINHAKAAGVAMIVAVNKMDKPTANPDKIKQQLTEHGLVVEEWGGDVICVPVSAKARTGIDNLLEMIQLVAEMKDLKANPDRMAKGTVIEAKLDKGRGPIATVLIQNGTLRIGDVMIAGTAVGRVRVMMNDKGQRVEEAGPSTPVEITGLAEVPSAGDNFNAVEDERLAKELVEKRRMDAKEEQFSAYQKVTLENLFDQISVGEMKELPIIVKGDVQGSVEAVKQSLEKLGNEEVRVRVIHGGVGAVSESDVMLAEASGAIIVGFNVRPDPVAKDNADRMGVDIRLYRIIYDAIEEMQSAMKGMLTPKFKDVDLGRAEVRAVYKITGVGQVAGCYVLDGKILRGANIRIVRDGIVMGDDKMQSIRRFKDDVKEVAAGYECGMTLTKYTDIKEGDIFEAYEIQEIKQ